MAKVMCSFVNRVYTALYDHFFLMLEDEVELSYFNSRHTPILMVNISGKTCYYVELLDFITTAMPEISFSKAYIYKDDEDKGYIHVTLKDTHITKHQLSILNSKCNDYVVEAIDDFDCEKGSPLGVALAIVIPLQ